ncbi:MAG TPA: permease-like cell division protein FtsX [Rhodanobacteraceae bacterium]|jgi:cell division transport system permease protein|nr:permease-like cell division protein FtsX [Rhodanobacteraceae bacterium]
MNARRQAERNARKPAPPSSTAAPEPRRAPTPVRARLGAWRDHHFYGFFSSLGRLAARPWATALTVLMLGFALALPLLFYIAFDNARALSGGLREAREVTVFLKRAVESAAADAFAAELRKRADVAGVSIKTPQQGLAEFRQLSGFGEALDILKDNPLPTVLIVTPRTPGLQEERDPSIVGELGADARVDLVQYDATWRRRLSDILALAERAVVVLAALLALATLLVIGNTIRADVQSRADEIAVMQLIGAGSGFVRRPFLYAGLWYGLLGGAIAVVVAIGAETAMAGPLDRLLASYDHTLALRGLDAASAVIVVLAGALLGWIGAFVATARHMAAGHPD